MSDTKLGRIPELDGIRGVAVALVLLWHYVIGPIEAVRGTFLWDVQAAGRLAWSGVDLFFVLSGFLIGGILLDSRESRDYFRVFYRRRFFRIIPLYAVVLVLTYAWSVSLPRDPQVGTGYWIAHVFFAQNAWMAATGVWGFFAVSWSLAVEEQFYLSLPAAIRFIKLRWLPALLAIGIVAAVALRVVGTHLWPGHPLAAYTLMPCRADALLLGVLGAYGVRNGATSWLAKRRYLLWAAAAVLLLGAGVLTWKVHTLDNLDTPLMTSVGYTWMALLYLSVLLLAVTQPQSWLGSVMRCGWLRWLGSIAYGVYLIHLQVAFIVFHGARHYVRLQLRTGYDVTAMVFALGITLGICQLSFRYFERPLIQLGHRSPIRSISATAEKQRILAT